MRILIIGGGGREHSLAWKFAQSEHVSHVYVAPGNAGTDIEPKCSNVNIDINDLDSLIQCARDKDIQLTFAGPETVLVAGVVDAFAEAGLYCVGPTQAAAMLEGSKSFAKDFMSRHAIPTARYEVFSCVDRAVAYVREQSLPIVIKADGLAGGKGVFVANTETEAFASIYAIMDKKHFGDAGNKLVIEDFVRGEELSILAISDGKHICMLQSARDHKARDNGGAGPNTGGMGAYSPVSMVDVAMQQDLLDDIVAPTISGMAKEGLTYTGILYAGLMRSDDGQFNVLEFNCRFGDPEAQVLLPRLKNDFYELCCALKNQSLDQIALSWDERTAVTVVAAAAGYPDQSIKADQLISGLDQALSKDHYIFHAGTKLVDGQLVNTSGRVLNVTALGAGLTQARQHAYQVLERIEFDGMFYRNDIGLELDRG